MTPPTTAETFAEEARRLRTEADEFVNELLENAPDSWDDDVAAEAIAVDYVRHLEAEVMKTKSLCLHKWCRWVDHEPCDHGHLPIPITEPEPF